MELWLMNNIYLDFVIRVFFLFSLVVNTVFSERIPVIAFDGIGPLIAHRGRV
jgi:hypothetical protein